MISDKEILELYIHTKKNVLPKLNIMYDLEKMTLAKANFFNKKSIHKKISDGYVIYRKLVKSTWELLYSSEDEFNFVLNNVNLLYEGKPALPNETKLGHGVEQLFYFLDTAVTSLTLYYDGKISKNVSNKMHDISISGMTEIMKNIDRLFDV